MLPLTTLVCGELPDSGAIRDILFHLGQCLDSLVGKIQQLRRANDKDDITLLIPYLGRAALEVSLTALVARFDPYRILAIRKSQVSGRYDLESRNPVAFSWVDDVKGREKPKDWDSITNADHLQRALLCEHFHDLVWNEAFLLMLDAAQGRSGGLWLSGLRKTEPKSFTAKNRTEAAKLYSEFSKAIHHEFVIPPGSQFDSGTVNDLVDRVWELVAGLGLTACYCPAIRRLTGADPIEFYLQAEKELAQ